jgi:hypothetical protein
MRTRQEMGGIGRERDKNRDRSRRNKDKTKQKIQKRERKRPTKQIQLTKCYRTTMVVRVTGYGKGKGN